MQGRGASFALFAAALLCGRAPGALAQEALEPAVEPAPAIVSWWLNQSARGEVYIFLDGADVLMRSEDLRAAGLGLVTGARRELDGVEHVSLATIDPPVTVTLDEREMTLHVEVDPRRLPTTVLDLRAAAAPPELVMSERASAFVNYAAHWRSPDGYDGYAEVGARRGAYLLYSTAMMDHHSRGRGLTQATWEDRGHLRRVLLGDAITPGDSLAGAALLGGVQIARAFELDPYRVHRPALGQAGVVRSPSTAEVYVNGALVRREQLPPGPFVATDLPAQSGAGETRVVVRDALGNEETYASSYYLPASLLAPGHSEYSYTLGLARRQLGRALWGYGGPALVAQHREGLTRWLTGGLRLEAGLGLASGGVNLAAGTRLGEVTAALAASYAEGGAGAAGALGYSYAGRRLTV
ncbi:MAG TPA: fimbria/pilus outer membrane usher protein, partial [Kofleriaceae bacterium]|nr:fimbria/pilus outer membrane usher protein [Kofleriaceae bacterium]